MYNIRHDHIYTSIREDMKNSPMGYCKTIHELSIADIIALINYSENCKERFFHDESWDDNILELKTYIEEFNGRL